MPVQNIEIEISGQEALLKLDIHDLNDVEDIVIRNKYSLPARNLEIQIFDSSNITDLKIFNKPITVKGYQCGVSVSCNSNIKIDKNIFHVFNEVIIKDASDQPSQKTFDSVIHFTKLGQLEKDLEFASKRKVAIEELSDLMAKKSENLELSSLGKKNLLKIIDNWGITYSIRTLALKIFCSNIEKYDIIISRIIISNPDLIPTITAHLSSYLEVNKDNINLPIIKALHTKSSETTPNQNAISQKLEIILLKKLEEDLNYSDKRKVAIEKIYNLLEKNQRGLELSHLGRHDLLRIIEDSNIDPLIRKLAVKVFNTNLVKYDCVIASIIMTNPELVEPIKIYLSSYLLSNESKSELPIIKAFKFAADDEAKKLLLLKDKDASLNLLNQITKDNDPVKAEEGIKPLDTLIEELKELNKSNQIINHDLKEQYIKILKAYDKDSSILPQGKAIKFWKEDDVTSWAKEVKVKKLALDKQNLSECLAVIKRANFLFIKNDPRAVQMLSLLLMLQTDDKGMLLQIATGEGKSTTTAMLAVYKALQGEKVDVITSSVVLAKRDAEDRKEFFKMFSLTCAHNHLEHQVENTLLNNKTPKPCYSADIVYGNIANFQFDWIRHIFSHQNTKGNRECGVVIVDEVDSMLIDESANYAHIASPIAGIEYLEPLFSLIWHQLNRFDAQIVGNKFISGPYTLENGVIKVFDDAKVYQINNMPSFRASYIVDHIKDVILNDSIRLPTHLKDFAVTQLDTWVNAAVRAKYLMEKRDYIISEEEGTKKINIVDYINTGQISKNTVWSDGVHQFLQIKHFLRITPETIVTSYISNLGYFKLYGTKIYGMTGTLGSKDSQALLQSIYSLNLGFIPTFKEKKFTELPAIITANSQEWMVKILELTEDFTAKNRAVLFICESIKNAEKIQEFLINKNFPAENIKLYTRNDNQESDAVKDVIKPKDIIIATNLAGRGTDIKTSRELEASGGLHVSVTFLPGNLRVEEQAFGRTARQGNNGTAQLIIDMEATQAIMPCGNIKEINQLKQVRDSLESTRLEHAKLYDSQKIDLCDKLFKEFCILYEELMRAGENCKIKQVEANWGAAYKELNQLIYPKFDNLKQRVESYGLIFRTIQYPVDSLFKAMEKLTGAGKNADYYKSKAIAYIIDNFSSKATVPQNDNNIIDKPFNNSSSDYVAGPKNAFNQREEGDYWYQATDITVIQQRIMSQFINDFFIFEPISSGEGFEAVLREAVAEARNKCASLGVYNVNGNHWVSFAIVNEQNDTYLIYKDSFGNSNAELERKVKSIFPSMKFIFNKESEQISNSNCGIFALQNMKIIAEHLNVISSEKLKFIREFQHYKGFCKEAEACSLRKEDFAKEYILGKYNQVLIANFRNEVLHKIREYHHNELSEEILPALENNAALRDIKKIVLRGNEEFSRSQRNTIALEIGTELANNNYEYYYRILWSNDINPANDLLNILGSYSIIDIDLMNKVIKFKSPLEKEHLDITRINITSKVPAESFYEVLSFSSSQIETRMQVKQWLQSKNLKLLEAEASQINANSNASESNNLKTSDINKGNDKNLLSDFKLPFLNDNVVLNALSILTQWNIIVIRSDKDHPEIYKYAGNKYDVFLALQAETSSSPAHYHVLFKGSSNLISSDLQKTIDETPCKPWPTKHSIDQNPSIRKDVLQLMKDLKQQQREAALKHNTALKSLAIQELKKFADKLKQDYAGGYKIMRVPAFLVWEGLSTNHTNKAIELFSLACNLDPFYSVAGHYNKAYEIIKRGDETYREDAYKELEEAKYQIQNVLIPNLEMLQITSMESRDNPLSQQIATKIQLLKLQVANIESTTRIIENCRPRNSIEITDNKLLEKYFENQKVPKEDIQELNNFGIYFIFEVEEVKPPKDWFGAVFRGVCGIAQIVLGIAASMSGNIAAGASLIIGGVKDCFHAVQIALGKEDFDLKQYFTEKGIQLLAYIIARGASKLLDKLKSAKELEGIQNAKELATAKAKEEWFASTVKEIAKSVVQETVINQIANVAVKETLSNFEEDVKSSIRRTIKSCIEEHREELEEILSIDRLNNDNNNFNTVKKAALEAFNLKGSKLISLINSVLMKLAHQIGAPSAVRAAAIGAQAAAPAYALKQILELAREICDNLGDKITTLKQQNSLESILLKKLSPLINATDVKQILAILGRAGLVNDGKVNDKILYTTNIDLGQYNEHKGRIIDLLKRKKQAELEKGQYYKSFENKLIDEISSQAVGLVMRKARHEIAVPAVSVPLNNITHEFTEKIAGLAEKYGKNLYARYSREAEIKRNEELVRQKALEKLNGSLGATLAAGAGIYGANDNNKGKITGVSSGEGYIKPGKQEVEEDKKASNSLHKKPAKKEVDDEYSNLTINGKNIKPETDVINKGVLKFAEQDKKNNVSIQSNDSIDQKTQQAIRRLDYYINGLTAKVKTLKGAEQEFAYGSIESLKGMKETLSKPVKTLDQRSAELQKRYGDSADPVTNTIRKLDCFGEGIIHASNAVERFMAKHLPLLKASFDSELGMFGSRVAGQLSEDTKSTLRSVGTAYNSVTSGMPEGVKASVGLGVASGVGKAVTGVTEVVSAAKPAAKGVVSKIAQFNEGATKPGGVLNKPYVVKAQVQIVKKPGESIVGASGNLPVKVTTISGIQKPIKLEAGKGEVISAKIDNSKPLNKVQGIAAKFESQGSSSAVLNNTKKPEQFKWSTRNVDNIQHSEPQYAAAGAYGNLGKDYSHLKEPGHGSNTVFKKNGADAVIINKDNSHHESGYKKQELSSFDYEKTPPVEVSGKRPIDLGISYEENISKIYGPTEVKEYKSTVDGKLKSGIADHVIVRDGKRTAIEAKYVDDWSTSPRNPLSTQGQLPFMDQPLEIINQAKKYALAFEGGVIYHTNSVEFANHYTKVFNDLGIKNFEFIITPTIKK
jgi:hypothetical protein